MTDVALFAKEELVMNMIRLGVILAATMGFCSQRTDNVLGASEKEIQKAYTDLTPADNWQNSAIGK